MSKITENIYIGGLKDVENDDFLKNEKITHILSVLDEFDKPTISSEFKHLFLNVSDDLYENIIQHFDVCHKFIDDCLKEEGRVLVHCALGVSRSSSIVISYLMKTKQIDYTDAFEEVKSKRKQIQPNESFVKQLGCYFLFCYEADETTYKVSKLKNIN